VELAWRLRQQGDDLAAVPVQARACDLGVKSSCIDHAAMYEWGKGIEPDREEARRLYAAACALGSSAACERRDRLAAQDEAALCVPGEGQGLDREEIKKVISLHTDAITDCYQVRMADEHGPKIDVSMAWVIGPDGNVSSATITKDTHPALGTGECVKAQVLRWRFPCPHGGGVVNVTFPWLMRPAE